MQFGFQGVIWKDGTKRSFQRINAYKADQLRLTGKRVSGAAATIAIRKYDALIRLNRAAEAMTAAVAAYKNHPSRATGEQLKLAVGMKQVLTQSSGSELGRTLARNPHMIKAANVIEMTSARPMLEIAFNAGHATRDKGGLFNDLISLAPIAAVALAPVAITFAAPYMAGVGGAYGVGSGASSALSAGASQVKSAIFGVIKKELARISVQTATLTSPATLTGLAATAGTSAGAALLKAGSRRNTAKPAINAGQAVQQPGSQVVTLASATNQQPARTNTMGAVATVATLAALFLS